MQTERSSSTPARKHRLPGIDARQRVHRALQVSLRARFLVALLAVIAVSETVIAVTFYNQSRQFSSTERVAALADRLHNVSDLQLGVAELALHDAPVTPSRIAEHRSRLRAYAAEAEASSGSPQDLRALRRLRPQFEALVRARMQLDRLPASSPRRRSARTQVLDRAAALTTTTTALHDRADARIESVRAEAKRHRDESFRALLIGTGVSLVAAIALALLLSRKISRPIARLAEGARELGAGRLGHRLAVDSNDEIGVLASEFNRMAARLEEAQATLEQRVEARTQELADVNVELDRHRAEQERLARRRRSLLKRLINVQEEERRRIARELHDEAGQSLTGLRLGIEAAEGDLRAGRYAQSIERLEGLAAVASDAIAELERLVLDLRPAQLDRLGLVATLRWYVGRFHPQTGVLAHLDVRGEARRLDPAVETALFRIAQEALTNVARHAAAGHVKVSLTFAPNLVTLRVEDDGAGFDAETQGLSPASVGLLGMREHAELVGGTLVIDSRTGEGTRVAAKVPSAGTRS